jgi:hypothetical protein
VAYEVGEVRAEVRVCEPEEVPLAAKAGPLSEDGEGKDLGIGERRGMFRSARRGRMSALPPVVHEHVQGDEHGLEVHGPSPFCEVTGRRWEVRALASRGRPP